MVAGGQAGWTPYCGAAPSPDAWLTRWNFDPLLFAGMGIVLLAWIWSGGNDPARRTWLCGAAALALLLFVSPFCALTSALFSARVTHHVLLTAAVAPLLVLSLPRSRVAVPGALALWTFIHAAVFWAWHAPALYSAALASDAIYWLMQGSLLVSAFFFWSSLRRAPPLAAVAALLASMVQMGLLGALITFAPSPLYAPHFGTTLAWGLTPLEDQQMGGLIMWAPSAGIYLGIALYYASRWLSREERGLAS